MDVDALRARGTSVLFSFMDVDALRARSAMNKKLSLSTLKLNSFALKYNFDGVNQDFKVHK